jgi:hypothetical protein
MRRTTRRWRRSPERRRRRRPGGRRPWWWPDGPMRAKPPRMSGLGGSSPPRVVQGLSLLLLAISIWTYVNEFCCKYMLNLCEQLNMIFIMHEHDIIIYSYICVYCDCMCLYVNLCMCLYVICDCVCTCMWIIIVCDFKIGTWNSGFWRSISNVSSAKIVADTYY